MDQSDENTSKNKVLIGFWLDAIKQQLTFWGLLFCAFRATLGAFKGILEPFLVI